MAPLALAVPAALVSVPGDVAAQPTATSTHGATTSAASVEARHFADRKAKPRGKRTVMIVGNNWAGTATIIDARKRKALATIDIVPDLDEELQAIFTSPDRLALYLAVQQVVAEGNDQYVDDMFTTPNGRYLAVSRPSLSDVVWIDLRRAMKGRSDSIVAEAQMDGFRTDHMGVSPDRRRLVVSDSTERQVIEFSMVDETLPDGTKIKMGDRLRAFPSGETPHENNYMKNGKRILHASIGRVYTPLDYPDLGPIDASFVHDSVKADRWMQIVRTKDFKVLKRWDMSKELAQAGHPGMSSAVRPVAITPNEKKLYLQVSFFHGLVEFDLTKKDPEGGGKYTVGDMKEPARGAVTRLIDLPIADAVKQMPREQYVLDSAHHGLAISEDGRKLCVAGTMSDYAAIVDRETFTPKVHAGAAKFLEGRAYSKPYWATEGPRNTCWLSMSGSDLVTVIDFESEKVIAEVPVGDHPQRVREGRIREAILARR